MTTAPPAMYQYDRIWHGSAHRNFCVPLRDGRTTIKVAGTPDYQLYFVRSSARPDPAKPVAADGLETPGQIDVVTPNEPHINGQVCLGVAL